MTNDGCKKKVHDGGRAVTSHACGRKLAGDPEHPDLCGLHVAAIRRRRTKEQARKEAQRLRDAETRVFDLRAKAVSKALGIECVPEWRIPDTGPERFIHRPTGMVKVDLAALEALAARLEQ